MIGALLVLQIATAAPSATVVYEDLPAEVVRLELFEWKGDRPGPRHAVVSGSRRIALQAHSRRQYVVAFIRRDNAYLVDGPFAWPDQDVLRTVGRRWHRTIGGSLPAGANVNGGVDWISADGLSGPWPRCFQDAAAKWFCWAVAIDSHGVVVLRNAGSIWWATTIKTDLSRAGWGRLVVVSDQVQGSGAKAGFGYPVAPPSGRLRGLRFETGPVAEARAVVIAPDVIWIAGDAVPPDAWLEVASDSSGPAYLSLHDVASGPSAVPVHVALTDRRRLEGRALSADGQPARGTLISVFRLIDPARRESHDPPRRVLAEEVMADEDGRFQLPRLGEAEYEVVAWHSVLGRASVPLPSGGTDLVIHLRSSGIARGRVLAGGRPVAGVDVRSVPDAAIFSAAQDITEVKGGDAQTDPDGRFSVAVSVSGGGELRIGGGRYPVKRIPLPRPPVPVFDTGDVILGDSISVLVVLDPDPGCDIRAAGPVGRTGLQVIVGSRRVNDYEFALPEPGLWEFTLACRGEKRSLSPGVVQIRAEDAGKEVRLVVR